MRQKVKKSVSILPEGEEKIILEILNFRGAILVKMKNVIPENASFQGYFTEVCFDTSEGNQLVYFQNDYFFKILWSFHEAHYWVKCR